MKKAYILRLGDNPRSLSDACRTVAGSGGNIEWISCSGAADIRTAFVEISAEEGQLRDIESGLTALGLLGGEHREQRTALLELLLPDRPGTLERVLELVGRHGVSLCSVGSRTERVVSADGTRLCPLRLELREESEGELERLTAELSGLCEVSLPGQDVPLPQSGEHFWPEFAATLRRLLPLTAEQAEDAAVQTGRLMRAPGERGESPLMTAEYVLRFAGQMSSHRGDGYRAELTTRELADGWRAHTVSPSCGCNTTVLENGGELLFIDGGYACFHGRLLALLRERIPDLDSRRRSLLLTHNDYDHAGCPDDYDRLYLSRDCHLDLLLEQRGEPCFRQQDPRIAPYSRLDGMFSDHRIPSLRNAEVIGGEKGDGLLDFIGTFSAAGLDFRLYEGDGGHVRGETLIICDRLKIAFTGDILVGTGGVTREQHEFNLISQHLIVSANTDSKKAKAIRALAQELLTGCTVFPGHGGVFGPLAAQTTD